MRGACLPILQHGDVSLNYEVEGEGEPVVLITGLGGDTAFWNGMVGLLSHRHRVITLDNRGVGLTDCGGKPFSVADMAADVVAILDHLGIERSHVLGWSMGGNIAQQLAVDFPERVGALVLVSTYARRPARSSVAIDTMIESVRQGASMETLSMMMQAFCLTESVFWRRETEGRSATIRQSCGIEGFALQKLALDGFDGSAILSRLRAPTLVIHGRADIMVPCRFGRDLASRIPGAGMKHVEGAGHIIPPKLYHRAVLEHLAKHPL